MKKQKKKIKPVELCPTCLEQFEDCLCDQLYPEQSLLNQDDQNIEDSFNIF